MTTAVDHVRTIPTDIATSALEYARTITHDHPDPTDPSLIGKAPALALGLPGPVLDACRPPDPAHGLFVLSGFPVDDAALGPTPASWRVSNPWQANEWSTLLLLLASAMGRVFGWHGQQDGRLVHDIVPALGAEREQTGASSSVLLTPHTEDAFHPHRADYLMLGCLRNHENVGTTAANIRDVDLGQADEDILTQAVAPILPDESYGDDHSAAGPPPPLPTVWQGPDGLCLRYDPAYTPTEEFDARHRAAYDRLGAGLEHVSRTVALSPGQFLVLDNDAVVHGRVPFTARYDGTDRWLKRVNVRSPRSIRPAAEAAEHGYGQEVVDPYA